MTGDDYCLAAHRGAPPSVGPVRSSSSGGLAEVIVYIREGLGVQASEPSNQEILLDQEGCIYRPRVLAVQAGQTLVIRNSDATLHNVHASPLDGRGFNIGQPGLRGLESRRVFEEPVGLVSVDCDVHGWMHATILVLDHPFFAVTDEDGRFSLDGLPPGEYVLEAWHETLGTRTQSITVREDQETSVEFSFES
jgi:plastocyanin